MTTYQDLKDFFAKENFKLVIAADAQTRVSQRENGKLITSVPAGGVAVSFDPIARASGAVYIGRGRTEEDKEVLDRHGKFLIKDPQGNYTLKRIFLTTQELDSYYNGFANQTLWPLCHVAFEKPTFKSDWYEGFKSVNEKFAKAIREEIQGRTFLWLNDYHLSLVPGLLKKPKNTIIGMFWHIPWPTWEAFRILPFKRQILESMLSCDFLAFHRGYHVRNFLETAQREFEVRIDEEVNRIYYGNSIPTTVKNLPMGIDTDVVTSLMEKEPQQGPLLALARNVFGLRPKSEGIISLFDRYKVILGVDRLDYTKGLLLRFEAIERFLEKYPHYVGKVVYVGIVAPSREAIPAYRELKKELTSIAQRMNKKFARNGWRPIHAVHSVFPRKDIINFYSKASLCLVTPRDDGMNLVSKEFVLSASFVSNPGMLVLSRFAGSAIDLTAALIVNPYDIEEVADNIKKGFEIDRKEKILRMKSMAQTLEERNVYEWAKDFVKNAQESSRVR